jgi:menaquinone-dependent protoporphyrinogen oxidase
VRVLVAYASRHGATQGIAERLATTLSSAGLDAEALPAASVKSVEGYDAFVIGSAAYMFRWLKDATAFISGFRATLASRPVWLFSSGPLGTEPLDAQGRDQKVSAVPRDIARLGPLLRARDHRVFFGAYDRDVKPIGFGERFVKMMPAAREALPAGDFRDWPEIDAWAVSIARELLSDQASRA